MSRCAFVLGTPLICLLLTCCGGSGSSGSTVGGGGPGPAPAPAPELGTGDGTPGSVTFTSIAVGGIGYSNPMDLEFSPSAGNELWIVNQGNESIVIIDDATGTSFTGDLLNAADEHGAWGHFLSKPSGIAFGAKTSSAGNGWTFATSQDSNNGGNNFMGPTLWSADRSVIGNIPNPLPTGWNTSHLDMLHSTTWGKGIAHEGANIYWTLGNAYFTVLASNPQTAVTRYNFNMDHGPGMDDHADGQKWHYIRGEVAMVAGVPSHLAYDAANGFLYICDTGNGRLLRLHTTTGAAGSTPVASFSGDGVDYEVTGSTLDVVVAPGGVLVRPSGVEYHNNIIYVSDYATGIIHAFDLSGNRVNWLDTGRGANSLTGITIGPDGRLYFCDIKNDNVTRIDP
jgi:hypothetical protein